MNWNEVKWKKFMEMEINNWHHLVTIYIEFSVQSRENTQNVKLECFFFRVSNKFLE